MKDLELLELCNERLIYNPDTGVFTWRVDVGRKTRAGSVAGSCDGRGYRAIRMSGRRYRSHRLAFLICNNHLPEFIDHVNGNRSDNRIINLRSASHKQNCHNQKRRSSNTSGIKGVSWHKKSNKWQAQICNNGNNISVGIFKNIIDAENALRSKRIELHGEFANNGLNKIT